MIALLISVGVLLAMAGVFGKLAGQTSTRTMIVMVALGALIALSSLMVVLG